VELQVLAVEAAKPKLSPCGLLLKLRSPRKEADGARGAGSAPLACIGRAGGEKAAAKEADEAQLETAGAWAAAM